MKFLYRFFDLEGEDEGGDWVFMKKGIFKFDILFWDNRFRFLEIYYSFGDFLGEAFHLLTICSQFSYNTRPLFITILLINY